MKSYIGVVFIFLLTGCATYTMQNKSFRAPSSELPGLSLEAQQIEKRKALYYSMADEVKKDMKARYVVCLLGRADSPSCIRAIEKLRDVLKAKPGGEKGFEVIRITDRAIKPELYEGEYMLTIDNTLSPLELKKYLQTVKFDADAYDFQNARLAYYDRLQAGIKKYTDVEWVECDKKHTSNYCIKTIEYLAQVAKSSPKKFEGYNSIRISDDFKKPSNKFGNLMINVKSYTLIQKDPNIKSANVISAFLEESQITPVELAELKSKQAVFNEFEDKVKANSGVTLISCDNLLEYMDLCITSIKNLAQASEDQKIRAKGYKIINISNKGFSPVFDAIEGFHSIGVALGSSVADYRSHLISGGK